MLTLTKLVLGDLLGYFFTNSSGHPVWQLLCKSVFMCLW
jgi:hypothetical protein